MKRQGNLIESIADLENLYLAFYKAKKGKAASADVRLYETNLAENLRILQHQIASAHVEVGHYRTFTVFDPKERLICAAPFGQRVLHHAIMNICHPYFEQAQIFHSYASRIGKGTYAALEQAKDFNRHHHWFLKLDFRKYFDSLDQLVLKGQLRRLFKDSRLLAIFDAIIDSFGVLPGKGVPIGNLTSQYFANHYLARLDHFVKEVLQIKAYARYMDDLVLWHNHRQILLTAGHDLAHYANTELNLTLKPWCFNRPAQGLPFLGYLLYPHQTRLGPRSRKRFIKKLHAYDQNLRSGLWTPEEYQLHIRPLIAFTEHADSQEFRKKVIADPAHGIYF